MGRGVAGQLEGGGRARRVRRRRARVTQQELPRAGGVAGVGGGRERWCSHVRSRDGAGGPARRRAATSTGSRSSGAAVQLPARAQLVATTAVRSLLVIAKLPPAPTRLSDEVMLSSRYHTMMIRPALEARSTNSGMSSGLSVLPNCSVRTPLAVSTRKIGPRRNAE
jgi:hypothetical protein